jgi:hypothetical protein
MLETGPSCGHLSSVPSSNGSMPKRISEPLAVRDASLLSEHAARAFQETSWLKERGDSEFFGRDLKFGHGSSVQKVEFELQSRLSYLIEIVPEATSKPIYAQKTFELTGTLPKTRSSSLWHPRCPTVDLS